MTDRATEKVRAPKRLVALWNGHRGLVLVAAGVVVMVATTLIATTAGEAERPVPSGAMPALDSQFATPFPTSGTPEPSEPSSPPVLPRYAGAPLWTVQLPGDVDDSSPDFAVTDNGFVLQTREEVLGLDRAGTQLWRFEPPKVDYFTVRATGSLVFVGYHNPDEDRWPQPDVIIALDAATGAERWRDGEASFWSVTTDTIYLSVCFGEQNNRIGDCQFSARDPRTNAIRWRIPTYASSSVVNDSGDIQALPTPPRLLIGSYPTGRDSFVISTHDPATGATHGRGYQGQDGHVGSVDLPTERTVSTVDDQDDNPANGCQATVTGFAVFGANETWRHTARTAKEEDGRRCGRMPISVNRGRLGITAENGAPSVLNVDTGAIEWSAPATGDAIAASDTTLLVVESGKNGAAGAELVAYRVGDAKPVWRAPFVGLLASSTVTITNSQVVITSSEGEPVGYDLTSGNAWSYGDSTEDVTATWFAVCDEGSCRGYAIG